MNPEIVRIAFQEIQALLQHNPAVALLGPRQCGKTTLARQLVSVDSANYFDLENPIDRDKLKEPMVALSDLRGLVVLDEIQRSPEIFPVLRVLCDRPNAPAKFLVLGSAKPDLLRQSSESLAGRIAFVFLNGLSLEEVGWAEIDDLWLKGGFPRAFLQADLAMSLAWRRDFIRTFVERDIPTFGHRIDLETFSRCFAMLAVMHGQMLNVAKLAGALGIDQRSVRSYVELLEGYYLLRLLKPWFANLSKREVRSPKVYVRDSGILHAQLNIGDRDTLLGNPNLGVSWEGFSIEQVCVAAERKFWKPYFWAAHAGGEVDLVLERGQSKIGIEFKRADAPRLSATARRAVAQLGLDRYYLVNPLSNAYPLDDRCAVSNLRAIVERIAYDDL